jgi:glutaredoxin
MEIHLYTEPGCDACLDAKEFLSSQGIAFQERDIRANPQFLRILTEELDSRTTPTLVVGNQIIVGFDQVEYQLLLCSSGLGQPIQPEAKSYKAKNAR